MDGRSLALVGFPCPVLADDREDARQNGQIRGCRSFTMKIVGSDLRLLHRMGGLSPRLVAGAVLLCTAAWPAGPALGVPSLIVPSGFFLVLDGAQQSTDAVAAAASEALRDGEVEEAVRLLEQARGTFPDDPVLAALLGAAYLESGDPEGAIPPLEEACLARPDDFLSRYNLGLANFRSGRAEAASRAFQAALELRPQDLQTRLYRALTLRDTGHLEPATDELELLRRRIGDDPLVLYHLAIARYLAGDYGVADQLLATVLDRQPDHAGAHYYAGQVALSRADPSTASRHFREGLDQQPHDLLLRLGLIDAALSVQDYGGAAEALAGLEGGMAGHPLVLVREATVKTANGDLNRAAEALRRALDLDPLLASAWLQLGQVQELRGELEQAVEVFEQGLTHFPGNADLLAGMGEGRLQLGDAEGARESLERAVDAGAGSEALYVLGQAYRRLGREQAAARTLERYREAVAARQDARYGRGKKATLNREGLRQLQAGHHAAAREIFEGLSDQYPDDARILLNLGIASLRGDEVEVAVDALQRAVSLDPLLPTAHLLLAEALDEAGEPERAEAVRERYRLLHRAVQ